jgi:acyl carrier protein
MEPMMSETTGFDAQAEIREALRSLLVELSDGKLREDDVDPTANLFDFGYVDSLSGVTFIAEIEARYGVRIEDLDLVERLTTLDAIAAHVHENA